MELVEASPKKKVQKRFSTRYAAEVSEDMTPDERRKKLGKLYEQKRKQNRSRVKSRFSDNPEVLAAKTSEERRKVLQKLYKRRRLAQKKKEEKKKKKSKKRPGARQAEQDGMALPSEEEVNSDEEDQEDEEEEAFEDTAGRAHDRHSLHEEFSRLSVRDAYIQTTVGKRYLLALGLFAELRGWSNMRSVVKSLLSPLARRIRPSPSMRQSCPSPRGGRLWLCRKHRARTRSSSIAGRRSRSWRGS